MKNNSENGRSSAAQLLSLISSQQQFDWRQYWFMLWRRKWWVIMPTFLVTCGGVVYALLFVRPIYEATTSVEVSPSRLLNRSVQSVTPGASVNVDYGELRRRILSSNYLAELSRRLDLNKDEEAISAAKALHAKAPAVPFEEILDRVLIENLRKNITVTLTPGSELFQISARHKSPQIAYYLVKTLTEIFIDESKRNELRGIRGVMEFSNEQLGIYKAKVNESEDKLRQLKERLALSQAKQVGMSIQNILTLRELSSSSEIAISDRQRRLSQLEKKLPAAALKLLWESDLELARIKAQIDGKMENFKKSASMTNLQSNYEITLNNEINILRQECQRLLASLISRLYPSSDEIQQTMLEYQMGQIDLYILKSRVKIADDILSDFVKLTAAAPADQLELQRLEDELTQNRHVYKIFFDQARGSQIEEALQHSDAEFKYNIFEPARLPIYGVTGSKRKFVSFCFAAGLVFGIAMIFVLEFLDQSIRSVEEVEELLHIPVWGIIPKISAPFNSWHRGLKKSTEAQEARTFLAAETAALAE
jgi:uncharacterized protein involved in exopolysaccharide biosynthesis